MDQLLCQGCKLPQTYIRGVAWVQCCYCTTINPVPGMDQLLCQGCKLSQTYRRGVAWVQCCYCNTINPVSGSSFQTTNPDVAPSQLVGEANPSQERVKDTEAVEKKVDDIIEAAKDWHIQNMNTHQLLMPLRKHHFNYDTLEELANELQNESVNQIVLHGKQGSGKTSLVKAVRDKLKGAFEVVLFATVSKNNVRSIQDKIVDGLDLKLGDESEFTRANKIRQKLDEMKKQILVIFDDVPTYFDPEHIIGVPWGNKWCKFLLTAPSKTNFSSVESSLLKTISMGRLSEKDALALLRQHSEIDDESSSKLNVANQISKQSKPWWPGEIIEIGSSLKDKPLEEWEGLLNGLRYPTTGYQIFLSFRGTNTRGHFTSSLYDELKKNGFKTFMDDKGLGHGDRISTKLMEAIGNSRLSIVILSANYPNSSWCLDELVHILKCQKTKAQLVWPVFHEVEPTEIRHQTGQCEGVMTELEQKFPEKIAEWKDALIEVCTLSGRTYKTGDNQPEFIQRIVAAAKEKKNYLYVRNTEMD